MLLRVELTKNVRHPVYVLALRDGKEVIASLVSNKINWHHLIDMALWYWCNNYYNYCVYLILIDIDECDRQTDVCEYHETCENTAGSYNCDCPNPDDKLALDGRRCISKFN